MFVSLNFRPYTGLLECIQLVPPSSFQSPLLHLRNSRVPANSLCTVMGSGTYAYASLRLQMGSTSDYSAVDIAANPTSDAGIFLPQVPPSSYEEWWSFLTSNIPPDSLCPEVSAEVGSQVSCGIPSLRLLTQIFRNILLVSVHQYNVLLFGASIQPGHRTLRISSLLLIMKDFLSSVFRTQCAGQLHHGFPR